ncbi:hypothetical protein [Marinobacter metalliresistant]|uniref:Uncharacterized protein n=1 Tax=Marinobacter metalliresistant TaxID=2961995 RepID=A0ABZ2W163_9GAMM
MKIFLLILLILVVAVVAVLWLWRQADHNADRSAMARLAAFQAANARGSGKFLWHGGVFSVFCCQGQQR